MNRNEAREKAIALFKEGYNCAQAVVGCYSEEFGVSLEDAVRYSAPFGGGMARMREVCGTVSGMMLVLGMAGDKFDVSDPEAKKAVYAKGQALAEKFREKNGSIVCRELLAGVKTTGGSEPEARTETYYKKRPCAELVGDAAEILYDYFHGEN